MTMTVNKNRDVLDYLYSLVFSAFVPVLVFSLSSFHFSELSFQNTHTHISSLFLCAVSTSYSLLLLAFALSVCHCPHLLSYYVGIPQFSHIALTIASIAAAHQMALGAERVKRREERDKSERSTQAHRARPRTQHSQQARTTPQHHQGGKRMTRGTTRRPRLLAARCPRGYSHILSAPWPGKEVFSGFKRHLTVCSRA